MGHPTMKRNLWKPAAADQGDKPPVWFAVGLLIVICSLPIACAVYG